MIWVFLAACAAPDSAVTEPEGACVGDNRPDAAPDETTGVLIVGAGLAGLAAAWEAEAAEAPYVLVEREAELGGTSKWAGGQMLFAGTPEQEAAGIVDSPDTLLAEWAELTGGGDPEAAWVQAFATQGVEEVHDWLIELGTSFEMRTTNPDEGSVHRLHQPEGNGADVAALVAAGLDPAHQRLGREVSGLICEGGRIVGASWRDGAGGTEGWTQSNAVVMATGGFLRDLDRVRTVRPELAEVPLWYSSSPLADGNGLNLVGSVGGTVDNLAAIGLYAHGTPDYRRPDDLEELGLDGLPSTLWVDAAGERFYDESDEKSFAAGEAVVARPGGVAWTLWDDDVWPSLELTDPLMEDTDPVAPIAFDAALDVGTTAFSAESLDALAGAIGVPAATLQQTVSTYEAGATTGDALGKDAAYIDAFDHPPFVAFRLAPVVAKGFGGVAVDADGVVLDEGGRAIPGLYAAGELVGMAGGSMVGDRGFSGSLSAVILSGRLTGRAAARGLD